MRGFYDSLRVNSWNIRSVPEGSLTTSVHSWSCCNYFLFTSYTANWLYKVSLLLEVHFFKFVIWMYNYCILAPVLGQEQWVRCDSYSWWGLVGRDFRVCDEGSKERCWVLGEHLWAWEHLEEWLGLKNEVDQVGEGWVAFMAEERKRKKPWLDRMFCCFGWG